MSRDLFNEIYLKNRPLLAKKISFRVSDKDNQKILYLDIQELLLGFYLILLKSPSLDLETNYFFNSFSSTSFFKKWLSFSHHHKSHNLIA
jgi:hypothetical protein